MNALRQGHIGIRLAPGEQVITLTGRVTTPFPSWKTKLTAKTMKAVDRWLMENALLEVKARGDTFNATWLAAAQDKPSQSDKDSAEQLLFAFSPPLPPTFL